MSDTPIPLPELLQGDLDEDTLRALFRDVQALGQDLELLVKGAPLEHAQRGPMTPELALEGLLQGRWRGVQLRYRHQGQDWWDTVMRLPTGFRVVRMRAPTL